MGVGLVSLAPAHAPHCLRKQAIHSTGLLLTAHQLRHTRAAERGMLEDLPRIEQQLFRRPLRWAVPFSKVVSRNLEYNQRMKWKPVHPGVLRGESVGLHEDISLTPWAVKVRQDSDGWTVAVDELDEGDVEHYVQLLDAVQGLAGPGSRPLTVRISGYGGWWIVFALPSDFQASVE